MVLTASLNESHKALAFAGDALEAAAPFVDTELVRRPQQDLTWLDCAGLRQIREASALWPFSPRCRASQL
jgi:hypothetical protein